MLHFKAGIHWHHTGRDWLAPHRTTESGRWSWKAPSALPDGVQAPLPDGGELPTASTLLLLLSTTACHPPSPPPQLQCRHHWKLPSSRGAPHGLEAASAAAWRRREWGSAMLEPGRRSCQGCAAFSCACASHFSLPPLPPAVTQFAAHQPQRSPAPARNWAHTIKEPGQRVGEAAIVTELLSKLPS